MNQPHFYRDVPRMGNVALSRHAIERAERLGLTQKMIEDVLWLGRDTPDGFQVTLREYNNIRFVIMLRPKPFKGAKLVKTLYKIDPRASAR